MSRQRLYYTLKPYLPWRLRNAARRLTASFARRRHASVWPIDASAGHTPPHWPGWPDSKQFAVILTHDVEGPAGLAKCRQIAELEMELGFRSSFNFVPEGDYAVTAELREWLTGNGFEVGVHDLQHDGKLYRSRAEFDQKATRINRYLRDWKASGFRSGFMLRNLDWIHDLDIQYDASTFDTDPFEPQPEAAGTIFPFWIPSSENSTRPGYVELPYTLPQDSTLFLVLGEKSPDIWLRKLDWVADHGGMALVNVHPDYVCFNSEEPAGRTFPIKYYTALLQHVKQRHRDQYINLRAKDAAAYVKECTILTNGNKVGSEILGARETGQSDYSSLRGKRAAVLLYSDYPADPRPRRAAQSMVEAGMEVDVFCLSEADNEPVQQVVDGVNLYRVRMKRRRDRVGNYIWLYSRFIVASFLFLTRRSFFRRYDVVHVHNMPDILVFGALVPKLLGARVILDLHDPMPELLTTIFGVEEKSAKIRLLKKLEKMSLGFADAVITVNATCRNIFSARSCPPEKIHVVMNSPDETIFRQRAPQRVNQSTSPKPFIIMYHGSLVARHGLDLAVSAVSKVRAKIDGIQLHVYGKRTPYLDQVMTSVQTSGLGDVVHYHGAKDLDQIARAIGASDVGIIPNRRSVFTELNTPTRIFEYLSQSTPVIAPRAQGILDYFGPDDLIYFELGDVDDLAAKILYVYQEPAAVAAAVLRGQTVYRNHCWTQERRRFLDLVTNLLGSDSTTEPIAVTSKQAPERIFE